MFMELLPEGSGSLGMFCEKNCASLLCSSTLFKSILIPRWLKEKILNEFNMSSSDPVSINLPICNEIKHKIAY